MLCPLLRGNGPLAPAAFARRAFSSSPFRAVASTGPLVQVERYVDPLTRRANGVVILTLNQPAQLNPLSEDMGRAFEHEVAALEKDLAVRAVILTGAGKAFSAGGDLKFLEDRTHVDTATNQATMHQFYERFLRLRDLPVPVIAAMNGAAVGAGFAVALACDIRIAAAGSKLGLNFVRLGITPGMGSSFTLEHCTNPQVAARLLLTGDLMLAEEALAMGIVAKVSPRTEVISAALELAGRIAEASPLAVRGTVQMLRASRTHGAFAEAIKHEASNQAVCYNAPDLLEGLSAVKSKRSPTFADATDVCSTFAKRT